MINSKQVKWLYQLSRNCPSQTFFKLVFSKQKKKSILFFTQHKSASTFITKIMVNIDRLKQGYKHINYSNIVDDIGCYFSFGKRFSNEYNWYCQDSQFLFQKTSYIYGPFRSGFFIPETAYFKKVLFLRDPRDSLISRYHSFGYSHGVPKDEVSKGIFLMEREAIRKLPIDDYCIMMASEWSKPLLANYRMMMAGSIEKMIFLKYEEYVQNPESVIRKIFEYCELKNANEVIDQLVIKAEPINKTIDRKSHKRSGRVGQFYNELKLETIKEITNILSEEINYFGWNLN